MTTFVLVHGSFHGAWCWQRLATMLQSKGHTVLTPELPGSGDDPSPLADANLHHYAQRVSESVLSADGPVVLVGHSMGAIVASQVTEYHPDRISAVVFVCGLLLRSGETLGGFLGEFAHLGVEDQVLKHMKVSADGKVATFPPDRAAEVFYNRCAPADADWAASRLRPQATAVYGEATHLTDARFGRVRRFYVEANDDRAVSPTYQRLMVERTPCEAVFRLDTDHSPFLSAPSLLGEALLDIAARTGAMTTHHASSAAPAVRPFYIDGQWRQGSEGEWADDINPATGAVFARIAQASAADVDDAIAAAHRARIGWQKMLAGEREALLLRIADVIASRADEIRDLIIQENGSVFIKAPWEVGYAVECLRVAAGLVRHVGGDTFPTSATGVLSMTIRQPLGVIAGIAPFNSPFLLTMKKVAFALAAGNTFVLKPSELTPLSGLVMAECFEQAGVPPGVFNVIPGPAEMLGTKLLADPRVRMVTFTGSGRVGRLLAAQAGAQMKRFTLEMGGKNPLVVLADADLDYAVDSAAFGIFFHQGQVCMASSKVIVEAPLYARFAEAFTAKARGIKVGDPRDPSTVIGPLIKPQQCVFIAGQIEEAVSKGARVLTGGTYEGPYFQPTVLAGVTPEMSIYYEESFGPVVSLIEARDSEHALAIANDTAYGLSSAIITNDLQKAFDFSLRSEAGMVHINDTTIADEPHIAFGGVKGSGFGREGGRASIEEMTELKWITVQLGKRAYPF